MEKTMKMPRPKKRKKRSEDNKSKYQTKRKEFNPNSLIIAKKEI